MHIFNTYTIKSLWAVTLLTAGLMTFAIFLL